MPGLVRPSVTGQEEMTLRQNELKTEENFKIKNLIILERSVLYVSTQLCIHVCIHVCTHAATGTAS